ncbi:hypothetical protein SAMD00019534_061750, partial [Acytostelium subglobosum LB1]|uniref:hypothetical protein n=1 Tax=Acytostelium subglobosum LB1 TaxID=1410327 RepID=UPI000644CA6E
DRRRKRIRMLQEQQGPRHTEILLRKEDSEGKRKALKEKFVEIYEAFFNGEDPSKDQPSFWEQLFLIKVNIPFLERCIILTSEDHLLALKPNINKIFTHCCQWLRNSDAIRITHILETLSVFLKSIFRKKFNNFGFDILNILCGIDAADIVFKELITDLQSLLKHSEVKIRIGSINLINIIVTATEFINQNTLLQFFMVVDLFPSLMDAIVDVGIPKPSRFHALTILVYLSNFQKYEIQNPYNKSLAALADADKLKGLTELIAGGLDDQCKFYSEQYGEPNQTMMSRMSGYLSSWVYTPVTVKPCSSSDTGSCLMILYELCYQSEAFVRLLTSGGLTSHNNCPDIIRHFLVYCGYLSSDTLKESKILFTKLCLNILICMSERRELEDYFHDVKTTCYIFIYSKKSLYPDPKELEKSPLSCHVVDVINQFIKCNLKGKLPADIHQKCVNCIQRIVAYKKKTQSRLPIKWIDTWSTLFSFLSSLSASDKSLHTELLPVGIDTNEQTINIFNLFVNYGDLFLPQPSDYDDLFYEIVRASQIIDTFSAIVQMEDPTGQLMNHLLNIKTITQHFNGIIQTWTTEHPEVSLVSEQVIKLIKENYDTLKLKLQENLDQYERFVESSKEASFYRNLVRFLVQDTKTNLNSLNL